MKTTGVLIEVRDLSNGKDTGIYVSKKKGAVWKYTPVFKSNIL